MAFYKIYAGIYGEISEGTPTQVGEFASIEDATLMAYDLAIEEYECYKGLHGITSYGDIEEDPECWGLEPDASEDEIWEAYKEERESWLNYWAEEIKDLDELEELSAIYH